MDSPSNIIYFRNMKQVCIFIKKSLQVFLLLYVPFVLHAQSKATIDKLMTTADSLAKEKHYDEAFKVYTRVLPLLEKRKDPEKKANVHNELGKLLRRQKKYEEAVSQFLKSTKEGPASLGTAYAYQSIALLKRKLQQKDSVLYYLEKALAIYKEKNPGEEGYNAFLNAGIIYKNYQKYEEALTCLLLADEGYTQTGNFKKLGTISNTIAQIQDALGDTAKAVEYYFTALNYQELVKDTAGIAMSYNNIANTYKTKKVYDSALFYYGKSLELVDKTTARYPSTLYNVGVTHYLKGDLKSARSFYEKALEINTEQSNTVSVLYNGNELALLAIENNDLVAARRYLKITSSVIDKVENQEAVYRNYEIHALYYYKTGNYKQAFDFQKKYSDMYQSVFNARQVEAIQKIQEQYETEKAQNENLRLTLLNQESEALINKQKERIKTNNLLLAILVLFLLLMMIAYLLLQQRQKALKNKQAMAQLKAMYKGQDTIKEVISKDLHDIIATSLDGIRLKVQALSLSKGEKKEKLAIEITNNIQDVNHQMRLLSHRLSPLDHKIKKYSLSEIIISQLTEFQTYRKILVTIKDEIPAVLNDLKPEAQTNFYAILLEALNNIEKHSKATEVVISHQIDAAHTMCFTMTDNGIGLAEENREGIGLFNIKERARLLQGICSVFQTSVGTELKLEFPLKMHLQ